MTKTTNTEVDVSDGMPSPKASVNDRLPVDAGPIVITAKGHSGTRFIAQALQEAGVFMGADMNAAFDSMSWHDDFAVPLMTSRWYPDWQLDDPSFRTFLDERLYQTVERYVGDRHIDGPWGWKGSTLFVTSLVANAFPRMRLLHIIRDGRDVALSQDGRLNLPLLYPLDRRHPVKRAKQFINGQINRRTRDDYRMKVFFGAGDLTQWNGIELTRDTIEDNRYLLQMQSWVRNVTEARKHGAEMGDRYLEIRYERLCREPQSVLTDVLDWLELPISDSALAFVQGAARTGSIGKWRTFEFTPVRRSDFERARRHGADLLIELGYDMG